MASIASFRVPKVVLLQHQLRVLQLSVERNQTNNSMAAYAYCQDNSTGVLYLHGEGNNFANMDVDCDGLQGGPVDGRCGLSTDTQSETAFKSTVQQYSKLAGNYVKDLNANFIPYVVFGNYGNKKGYNTFHPTKYGVKPLSVMAVVCGDQLVRLPTSSS